MNLFRNILEMQMGKSEMPQAFEAWKAVYVCYDFETLVRFHCSRGDST